MTYLEQKIEELKGKTIEIIGDHPFAGEQAEFVWLWKEGNRLRMEVKNERGRFFLWNTQTKIIDT